MSEEGLGKLAYEAWQHDYRGAVDEIDRSTWEIWRIHNSRELQAWIAVGRAIAEQVLAEQQCANEASGA